MPRGISSRSPRSSSVYGARTNQIERSIRLTQTRKGISAREESADPVDSRLPRGKTNLRRHSVFGQCGYDGDHCALSPALHDGQRRS